MNIVNYVGKFGLISVMRGRLQLLDFFERFVSKDQLLIFLYAEAYKGKYLGEGYTYMYFCEGLCHMLARQHSHILADDPNLTKYTYLCSSISKILNALNNDLYKSRFGDHVLRGYVFEEGLIGFDSLADSFEFIGLDGDICRLIEFSVKPVRRSRRKYDPWLDPKQPPLPLRTFQLYKRIVLENV